MVRADAYSEVDLDQVYSELDKYVEENGLKRLEPDFGTVTEKHVFVQADSFNGFLYKDRAILHILNADTEDPIYSVLDEFYDIDQI